METAHVWVLSPGSLEEAVLVPFWGSDLTGKVAFAIYGWVGSYRVRGIFPYLLVCVVLTTSSGSGNSSAVRVHEPELGVELGSEPRSF